MKSSQLRMGICGYPTQVILIDDSEEFLTEVGQHLKRHQIAYRAFSHPAAALHYLNTEYTADPFLYRCVDIDKFGEISDYKAHFFLSKVHEEVYQPQRYQQVVVVISDEVMPAKNGLALCKEIQDQWCQKIILTGEAGQEFAVQAFNDGIINKFIQKSTPQLPGELLKNIRELQTRYFVNLTNRVMGIDDPYWQEKIPPFLKDEIFIEFFHDLCAKHHIVEYYLLDEYGSFLLLDKKAKPSWLIMKSEEMMYCEYEAAKDGDDISAELVQALKDKTAVPYLHTQKDIEENLVHPEKFMHPASVLKAEQTYYYSYVTRSDAYELQRDKILSFEQFLEKQTAVG